MKKHLYILLTLFFLSQSLFGFPGELKVYIVNTTTQNFKLDVTTNQYTWTWDNVNSKVVSLSSYSFSTGSTWVTSVSFDAPNDKDSAPDGVMPWGLMNFSITSNDGNQYEVSFTLDLRDENWAVWGNYQSSSDSYILLNAEDRKVYLSKDDTLSPDDIYISDSTVDIWEYWQVGLPKQNNFTIPVILKNRIEGQTFDFGNLLANNEPINSGDPANYQFNLDKSVNVGTPEYQYSNKRNYNFKWSFDKISPLINTNIYNAQLSFTIPVDQSTKSITRNFRPAWSLTIKNSLGEVGGISVDSIYFKDPTTDNQYNTYSAVNNGFVKDNAFDSLDIDILPLENQKYGAKALSTISYNGQTYQYSGGDFTTTGTDLLITDATTLTANYKGIQLSSQTDAIANNGQRKLIKTPDGYLHQVYESLDKVWYERSTDNGQTWELFRLK